MPAESKGLSARQEMKFSAALRALPDIEVSFSEPMSRHTTFRVGGPVACLALPRSERALVALLQALAERGLPHVILGGGSNVLAPDGPWEAAAILLKLACSRLLRLEEGTGGEVLLYAGAGKKVGELVRYCLRNELEGMEFLAGIPGTVGGALVMNAGTPSGTISESLVWLDLIDREGSRRRLAREELSPGYRTMGVSADAIVTGGCFRLRKTSGESLQDRVRQVLDHRRRTQPLRYPSAGSVFKNPPGQTAGALIEKAGLKGFRIGDAQVSSKHANWIINRGNASAKEILALIEKIENEIHGIFGVRLEREIRILD
ncbi:MAG: UDP-N-acetylmuramate dehydrogenase [Desulfobacteraceae bacterium]|nr:UDP-N-acetylmuramate dehydrogenase [Desulfobacteraceae bacterium]